MAGVIAGAAAVALPAADAAIADMGAGVTGILVSVWASGAGRGSGTDVLVTAGTLGRLGVGVAGQLGNGALTGVLVFGSSSAGGACGKESPSEASRSATNDVSSVGSACTVSACTGSTFAGSLFVDSSPSSAGTFSY